MASQTGAGYSSTKAVALAEGKAGLKVGADQPFRTKRRS